jgi:hypothetical protein
MGQSQQFGAVIAAMEDIRLNPASNSLSGRPNRSCALPLFRSA